MKHFIKGNAKGETGISHRGGKKKNEEDRGRTELLEVIISSARLLVSDADGRVRLTAALDPGTAAGLRDERLLDGALSKLVPKVVYTVVDKGGAVPLQYIKKKNKHGW